jgi:hypothetical protein
MSGATDQSMAKRLESDQNYQTFPHPQLSLAESPRTKAAIDAQELPPPLDPKMLTSS